MTRNPAAVTVTVKMFDVGELGDCFWLQFATRDQESNVLIDCGSFRNSEKSKTRLNKIAGYIRNQLNDRQLDVVVGTHQHNDHVSGFVHCEKIFTGMVDQTWLSWLDNPRDQLARSIKKDQLNLVDTVSKLQSRLPATSSAGQILKDVLGFYAASGEDEDGGGPELPARGIEILKQLPEKEVRYLSPGDILPLPGMPRDAVRVYVLGPPRNQTLLFDKDPKKTETYDPNLAFANINAKRFLSALENNTSDGSDRAEKQFPFSSTHKKSEAKAHPEMVALYKREPWRMIEDDWMQTASRLALYLDSYTNNSSLVLAFELVKSGKILLFAADAQTGNWLSWDDIKWKGVTGTFSTEALLRNTVLYKVGHHGSHNATLVKALESMEHSELVAMIPVCKTDPNITKKNGWKMPAKNLYKRLKEKTGYRVLRMDDGYADGCDPQKNKGKTKWKSLPYQPRFDEKNFFVEYTVTG